jgi:NADH:ubiquinone oxidoreductase subunit E
MQKAIILPSTSETRLEQFILNVTAGAARKDLIHILQSVQENYGYLSKESMRLVATNLEVSFSEVYGVATFYHQFRLQPPGTYVIQVCMGTGCHAKGNADNFEHLKLLLDLKPDQNLSKDKIFSLEAARCFGCCSLAPVIMVTNSTGKDQRLFGHVNLKALKKILAEYREKAKHKEVEQKCEMMVYQRK